VCGLADVEERWPGWYYAPDRWATRDGVIPHTLFGLLRRTVDRQRAVERLNLAAAIRLAFAGREGAGPSVVQAALDEAYPKG
jgi:hypothetical protein